MPKAKLHWGHDLLAMAVVGGISGLVFWLLPPATPTRTAAARGTAAPVQVPDVKSTGPGFVACAKRQPDPTGEPMPIEDLFGVLRHAG